MKNTMYVDGTDVVWQVTNKVLGRCAWYWYYRMHPFRPAVRRREEGPSYR